MGWTPLMGWARRLTMTENSRLRWLCRRGMKELDVLMITYLEQCYAAASSEDQQHFRTLLEGPDPDLYALLLGREQATDPKLEEFARRLRSLSQTG